MFKKKKKIRVVFVSNGQQSFKNQRDKQTN